MELDKISNLLDSALLRNAQVNRTKPSEVEEATNLLSATRSGFRHTALDYTNALTLLQARKRNELLSTVIQIFHPQTLYNKFQMLSFMQANSTFFHQGTDLTSDLEPVLKRLGDDLVQMRQNTSKLEKSLEQRHEVVSGGDDLNRHPMQGYLFKRTSNAFKTWHRRWFIVQDHQLVYRKRTGKNI